MVKVYFVGKNEFKLISLALQACECICTLIDIIFVRLIVAFLPADKHL